jgi:hypothetical protein
MAAVGGQRIERQRRAAAGQHAWTGLDRMQGDEAEKTVDAEPVGFGVGVAHAAGGGRAENEFGLHAEPLGRLARDLIADHGAGDRGDQDRRHRADVFPQSVKIQLYISRRRAAGRRRSAACCRPTVRT